jgi:hypothetical protein
MVSQAQALLVYWGADNPADLASLAPLTADDPSLSSPHDALSGVGTGTQPASSDLKGWEIAVVVLVLLGAASLSGECWAGLATVTPAGIFAALAALLPSAPGCSF